MKFPMKPQNAAAWVVAGIALYAWSAYDARKLNSQSFSKEEITNWNDEAKDKAKLKNKD